MTALDWAVKQGQVFAIEALLKSTKARWGKPDLIKALKQAVKMRPVGDVNVMRHIAMVKVLLAELKKSEYNLSKQDLKSIIAAVPYASRELRGLLNTAYRDQFSIPGRPMLTSLHSLLNNRGSVGSEPSSQATHSQASVLYGKRKKF